jgi:uncharacterized protein (UPF0332 family)
MSGEEFLDIANRLLKAQTEAAYRTVVNRGYYAAFHVCAAFLAELGFKTSDGPRRMANFVLALIIAASLSCRMFTLP